MLPLYEGNDTAVLVGMDPGSTHLGVCLLTFNIRTFALVRIESRSYNGNKLPFSNWAGLVYGDRYRRIQAHQVNLVRIFEEANPVVIATEAPFFNSKFPNAFAPLVEVLVAMQEAVRAHNPWMTLTRVSPSEVKNAVGAKGGAKKDPVKEALLKNQEVCAVTVGGVEALDEHAIDAVGVALFVLEHLKTTLTPLE
jgi:Holliday junction resolvasome RuvABC endonuclease subunit